jgi:PEGA domain/Tetratricopeptide repeat
MLPLPLAILLLSAQPAPATTSAPPPAPAAKPPPAEAAATERAKALFTWAQRLYRQARYQEAIAKFEEAYALRPHPVIFFNIGKCWEQLGETPKAMRAYKDYLRLLPEAPDREIVADAIVNLERRLKEKGVQQLLVFADPQTARIEVDGKGLGTSPASVELVAGNHLLKVTAEGYEPAERSLVISAAHSTEITINLRPRAPEPAPAAPTSDAPRRAELVPPASSPPEVPVATAAARARPRVFTWVAGGLAVAGLGAGVGLGLAANGKAADFRATVHPQAQAQALYRDAGSFSTAANVSYAVAAAAAATAVVLFFVER